MLVDSWLSSFSSRVPYVPDVNICHLYFRMSYPTKLKHMHFDVESSLGVKWWYCGAFHPLGHCICTGCLVCVLAIYLCGGLVVLRTHFSYLCVCVEYLGNLSVRVHSKQIGWWQACCLSQEMGIKKLSTELVFPVAGMFSYLSLTVNL